MKLNFYSTDNAHEGLDSNKLFAYFPDGFFNDISFKEIKSYLGFRNKLNVKKTLSQVEKNKDVLNLVLTNKKMWFDKKDAIKGNTVIVNTKSKSDVYRRCAKNLGSLVGLREHLSITFPGLADMGAYMALKMNSFVRQFIPYSTEQGEKLKEACKKKEYKAALDIISSGKKCLADDLEADSFCEIHMEQLESIVKGKNFKIPLATISAYVMEFSPSGE